MSGLPVLPSLSGNVFVAKKIRDKFKGTEGKRERCAVIIGQHFTTKDGNEVFTMRDVVEVPNFAENSEDEFEIRASALENVRISPDDVVGVVHTHNKGSSRLPSIPDIENIKEKQVGAVYHVTSGSIIWYTNKGFLQKDED